MAQLDSLPILSSFRILGLHGYKNVTLDFSGPVRIVIAENGMGKTTILSALQAFLSKKFLGLQNLSFESIECRFTSVEEPLVLHKQDIPRLIDSGAEEKLRELSQFTDIDASALLERILGEHFEDTTDATDHPILEQIYYESPFSSEQILDYVRTIQSSIQQTSPAHFQQLVASITSLTRPFEILYLPTYRRIEIPLQRTPRRHRRQHQLTFSRFNDQRRGELLDLDIQFGLSDVSNRLTQLFETIQRHSNSGYRSISANIIDDLLAGLPRESHSAPPDGLPEIDALARFFSRINKRGGHDDRLESLRGLYKSGEMIPMSIPQTIFPKCRS